MHSTVIGHLQQSQKAYEYTPKRMLFSSTQPNTKIAEIVKEKNSIGNSKRTMARRGAPNEDLSNIEFETSEDVEVVPTFNSMVSVRIEAFCTGVHLHGF